jgi:hypothetical protein
MLSDLAFAAPFELAHVEQIPQNSVPAVQTGFLAWRPTSQ